MPKVSDYINYTKNPRQQEAYKRLGSGEFIFYGGSRGGGKSHLCLSSSVSCCIQFPGIKVVILRRYYPELQDLFIDKLCDLFPENVFGYTYKDKTKTAYFKNGSKIIFKAAERIADAKKVKGLEYQLMIIDEANEFDEEVIKMLIGSLRKTKNKNLKGFLPTLLMTGNPGGVSDLWFKRHFIKPQYEYWKPEEMSFKELFVFIPAKLTDNPYIDQEDYVRKLDIQSPTMREAWLNGNWDVYEGQFFTEYNPDVHVVKQFKIPDDWKKVFGIDLGWTKRHPTVGLWAAQDPRTQNVFVYREYVGEVYNTEQYADDVARQCEGEHIDLFFGDPAMFDSSKKKTINEESDASIFIRKGIPLMRATNERVMGWRIVKDWLHWTPKQRPKLFIFDCCRQLIETLPILRYDKNRVAAGEDLDTHQADDAADTLRYILMSGFGYPTNESIQDNMVAFDEKVAESPILTREQIMRRFRDINGVRKSDFNNYFPPTNRNPYRDVAFKSVNSYYL